MVSSGAYHFATGDGPQTAQAKGFERGFSSLTGVASNKAANWGNIGELELLSSAGRNIQGSHLPSGACMTFSNGLGGFSVGQGVENREGHIVSYLPGSNVQGETMQTLHLMNPHYAGYTDTASQAGNVVLVNPSAIVGGQDNPAGNNSQLQQHYIGYSVSPSLTQSSMAQQPTLSTMYNSALVAQPNTPPSSLFANRFGHWAAGNELSFLPLNDATRITQPLAARLACMEPGQQQPTSNISQLNMRQHLSLHDEQASMLQNGVALGLNMDNSQASCGPNQGLSLSLSAQQYPLQMQYYRMQPDESGISGCQGLLHGAAEESSRDDGYPQKWVGNLSQFRTSSHDGSIGRGYQNAGSDLANRQIQAEASVQTVVGFRGLLTGSKYLKAAQLLLEEVVSLGCGMKNNSSKHSKLQSWMTPSSRMDGSSPKDGSLVAETMSTAKEGVACITSAPSIASGPEQKTSVVAERTPQENQELQMKKAKLMAMLDEVDRRYKQYFSQMEAVISSFESAAGLGAAKTYTALALQTISKHFRGLRDAIGGQIRAASRALGEEDTSSLGLGRLRYVDQQLRQQRALQQLGTMQQHAWRPQRGLPERSVSVLRAWLFEHFLHPYPKDADKHMLARQTGLSRNQVSNWFINARVRLWKPMVEEMYLEEIKEAEIDRTSTDQKSNTENSDNLRSNITGMDDQGGVGIPDNGNKQGRDEAGSKDAGMMLADKQMVLGYQHGGSNNILQQAAALDGADTHLFQGIKKARNADVLASYTQEFKSEDIGRDEEFENEDKHGFTMRGIDHAFGGYHDEGEGFSAVPAGYNGVSLTLGLQHSDGLSLAGAQQQQYYLQQQQQQQLQLQGRGGGLLHHFAMAGSRRRLEEVEDYYSSIDSAKNYEALAELQTRKRFASHILHET